MVSTATAALNLLRRCGRCVKKNKVFLADGEKCIKDIRSIIVDDEPSFQANMMDCFDLLASTPEETESSFSWNELLEWFAIGIICVLVALDYYRQGKLNSCVKSILEYLMQKLLLATTAILPKVVGHLVFNFCNRQVNWVQSQTRALIARLPGQANFMDAPVADLEVVRSLGLEL